MLLHKVFLGTLIACSSFPISNAGISLRSDIKFYRRSAALINSMIDRYVSPMTNTLNIVEKCFFCREYQLNFQTYLTDFILHTFNAPIAILLFNGKPDTKPWEYNFFIVDAFEAFDELTSQFPQTLHDRDFYFVIILTAYTRSNRELLRILNPMFEKLRALRVLNVVVINSISEDTFGFYTYEYFTPISCSQNLQVREINRYQNGTLQHDYLFPPNRLSNFYNCTLQVTATILFPVMSFYGDPNDGNHTSDLSRLTGIEGDILKFLADSLHFRINLTVRQGISDIYNNGSGSGCFADLLTNEASIGIGAFSNSQPNRHYLSTSISYHQTPFIFVLRSGLRFSSVERLAFPFCRGVWASLAGLLIIAILFLILLGYYAKASLRSFIVGGRNQYPITNLITILLGNPITILPQRNFSRFLHIAWMLATLVLRNAYQAKLFDSLRTSDRLPIPRNIPDLIEHNFILLSHNYTDFYPTNMTLIVRPISKRYEVVEDSYERYTTITLLDTLTFYNEKNVNTSSLTYMHDPIYHMQTVMFFQKNSVLRETFDNKLYQLMSSGITARIANSHVKKRFRSLNANAERLEKLSNRMLKALYMLYYILIFIAIIIFALEMRAKHSPKLKRIMDRIHK